MYIFGCANPEFGKFFKKSVSPNPEINSRIEIFEFSFESGRPWVKSQFNFYWKIRLKLFSGQL